MKRFLSYAAVSLATLLAAVVIGLGPRQAPRLLAQSPKVGGRDVPVIPFEQWEKRLGLINATTGCDVALEYDSLNTARITDCTDAANLENLKVSNLTGSTFTLGSDVSQVATVTVSSANILAMNATPVTVLAAPGAGKVLVVDSVVFEMTTTSTQYANGGVVSFVYHGGSTAAHAGTVPAAVVTAGAGSSITELGPPVATNGTTLVANTAIDITNGTAAFITGTGTAKVLIRYRVVTL